MCVPRMRRQQADVVVGLCTCRLYMRCSPVCDFVGTGARLSLQSASSVHQHFTVLCTPQLARRVPR